MRFSRLLAGLSVLMICVSCAIASGPEKRARMATAIPSQTALPLIAPFRATDPNATIAAQTPAGGTVLDCSDAQGTIQPQTVDSSLPNTVLAYFVYLPPCYKADSTRSFPVLYLFHGYERTPEQWLSIGLPAAANELMVSGRIPPAIIILPYVPGAESNDAAILADLLPAVDGGFRTKPNRADRAVGGISLGAEWALRLGLRRADLFGAIGLHSIILDETTITEIHDWSLAVPDALWPRIYADEGFADPQLPILSAGLLPMWSGLSRPIETHLQPGDHSDAYWSTHLREYLEWYGQGWK